MKKNPVLFLTAVLCTSAFVGCSTADSGMPLSRSAEGVLTSPSVVAQQLATDPAYGYTPEKPIKVGGIQEGRGPANERVFLGSLRGPNGEAVRFERKGSCCAFPTPNGLMGKGLLDRYAVWVGAATAPRILYLNMYDYERPQVPMGFTAGR